MAPSSSPASIKVAHALQEHALQQQQPLALPAGPSMVAVPAHTPAFSVPVLPVYPLSFNSADITAARMMGPAGANALEALTSHNMRVSGSNGGTNRRGSSLGSSNRWGSSVGGSSRGSSVGGSSFGSSGGSREQGWAEPLSLSLVCTEPLGPVCVVGLAAMAVGMGFKADGSCSPL